ncbi:MAG: hypothetical protein L0Y72_17925 [Gemmataceae bacterium]|nr:hypothetical protein [Gemmataceae bacterium]MCI0740929.1 hypothetical protein [Gemmataceae bacterium]
MKSVKEEFIELANSLPDDCSWDDVMYRIYMRQRIEAGLKDVDEGRLTDHDDVFKEFAMEPKQ